MLAEGREVPPVVAEAFGLEGSGIEVMLLMGRHCPRCHALEEFAAEVCGTGCVSLRRAYAEDVGDAVLDAMEADAVPALSVAFSGFVVRSFPDGDVPGMACIRSALDAACRGGK
ncbi:MAG: hypothetical protein MJ058_04295 [Akkermansia sp.]|nr:hypothetical protein [Akkermansia sp.]